MPNLRDFALNMIGQNPQINTNPQAQTYIDAIRSGDNDRMKTIALNICNTYGMTVDQATSSAMQFFGLRK